MRIRRNTPFIMSIVFVAILIAPPVASTTIEPLDFEEVVQQAGLVVEGTVIDARVLATGSNIRVERAKNHTAPLPQSEDATTTEGGSLERPQSVGVEGGRMLFTEITMSVDAEIIGDPGSSIIRFRVAGGTDGQVTAVVFGMPTFEVGKRYLVFLQPEFEMTNIPIVGVNQGFFEIARLDEVEMLINVDGDIVIGVEHGQVLLKHNPDRWGGHARHLADAPMPATGSDVRARTSPQVQRYWSSTEPPMSRESFAEAVLAARGGVR